LSRIPPRFFADEVDSIPVDVRRVNAILSITADCQVPEEIKAHYEKDEFCPALTPVIRLQDSLGN
jgi:hypothetical protein